MLIALLTAACDGGGLETTPSPPRPAPPGLAWERLAPAPTPRSEVTATAVGNRIYAVGGFDGRGSTVPTVEVYDTEAGAWEEGRDLPVAVNHPMSAVGGDTLYVLGGYLGPLSEPTDRAFALRDDGRWLELPPMPEARAAGGAGVVGSKIYVVGGVGPEGLAETTLAFDTRMGLWVTLPGLLMPREHLGVGSFDGRVYAVGGRTGGIGTNLGDAEAFNPRTETWRPLPPMPTPRGGLAAAATSNGFVVAPGGEESGGTFTEAEALDTREGRWVALPPLPAPRHGLGVAAVGTTVYVIAGGPTPGLSVSGANEALDLAALRG